MMLRNDQSKGRTVGIACGWWVRDQSLRLFSLVHEPVEACGSVLILPPLGLKSEDLFMPAFYAASAGARAVRFDGCNNVGLSDGEVCDFRLGVLLDDARSAAERLVKISGSDDLIIYGMSITATVALLLAKEYPRARVVLFVPVVDIFGAIEKAARAAGLVDAYRRRDGDAATVQRIFGHDIHAQSFYDDLVQTGLGTVEGVLAAARAVSGRADLVMAGDDEFSSSGDRRNLIEALDAQDRSVVLEDATHNFGRSPVTRKRAFGRLIQIAQDHFNVPGVRRPDELPLDSTMVAAARLERTTVKAAIDGLNLAA
jgi:hypothetical protein